MLGLSEDASSLQHHFDGAEIDEAGPWSMEMGSIELGPDLIDLSSMDPSSKDQVAGPIEHISIDPISMVQGPGLIEPISMLLVII